MPFIQKQTIPISFQGGLAMKTDALQVQSPNLLEIQNAQFDKIGQLNKRPGYNILPTTTMQGPNIATAVALDTFNKELNLFDNQSIYAYSAATQTWSNRGPAISLINTDQQIIRTSDAQQLNQDGTSLKNINVFAWEDSRGGVRYSVLDNLTGSYCIDDMAIPDAAARPKTIAYNGLVYLFYTSNNTLFFRTINPSNPFVISASTAVISDGAPGFAYDVSLALQFHNPSVPHQNNLYIAYFNSSGGTIGLNYLHINIFGAISGTTAVTSSTAFTSPLAVSVVVDGFAHLWVSFSTGTDVHVYNVQNTLDIKIDTVVCPMIGAVESINQGSLQLIYEVFNANPSNEQVKSVIVTSTGTINSVGSLRGVGLATKPFAYQNNIFVHLAYQSTLQSTYFMVFLTSVPFTICSKVGAQVGGGLRTNNMLSEMTATSPGVFLWTNLVKSVFISEGNTNFSLLGVNSTVSDFTNINKFNSVTFSNNLLFVGGILQSYDGVSVVEQNFHVYPEGVTAQANGSGGSLSAGQYQYQAVYTWSDKFGQIQYSTPSPAVTVTTVLNDSVTITIPTIRLTAKSNVVIKIYRTQVNGTVFQEVTSELAPLLNSISVDSVTFLDTAADSSIDANQTIYTTGGILPNSAPPSCSMVSLFQDRVILGGLEDRNLLWFSKSRTDNSNFNTIPVEFSAFQTIGIDPTGGPITALTKMDQNIIIFKESAIFILSGDGPNAEGGGDSFPDAQLVTQQVGCTNPNSIIFMGQGIMFQSPNKGIWLLDRNLSSPEYIGNGVDDLALQYQVSSATLDQANNLVIFTTFNGPALVYDYLLSRWSTFTNHQAVDSVVFQGLFTFAKSNGSVYQQNPAIFYDGYVGGVPMPYSMEFITPWLSYDGMLGYQSIYNVRILGQYKGPHTLNAYLGYDFNPAFTEYAAIPTAGTAGSNLWGSDGYWGQSTPWGGTWHPYIYQVNSPIQKCTSFRIKVSDSQTQPYNEAFTVNTLLIELGRIGGGIRLPATNKFSAQ